ncbi:MAG: hypothetical protein A2Y16_04680 [Tenericutes bacterium GWF2_57_13]|nr:MAG: hypothetical protein A2Y16_04680 [Tenericutes bacterium GWF2_57_13]
MFFINIIGLEELEKAGLWEEARKMLLSKWKKNVFDVQFLIRVATECWIVLTNWCLIDTNGLDYRTFKETLLETTKFGLDNFYNNSLFLCIIGYMISINPASFCTDSSDDDYLFWENKAKEMLYLAHTANPENMIFKKLYYGQFPKNSQYEENSIQIQLVLSDEFLQNTSIEKYFKDILTDKNILI